MKADYLFNKLFKTDILPDNRGQYGIIIEPKYSIFSYIIYGIYYFIRRIFNFK